MAMQRYPVSGVLLAATVLWVPSSSRASVKIITPVQTGVGSGTGAAGAVSGSAGTNAGLGAGLAPSAGVGQTTLINVRSPGVEASASVDAAAVQGREAAAFGAVPAVSGDVRAASSDRNPGSGPAALAPSGVDRPAAAKSIESTMKDLSRAKAKERKGASGAVAGRLDALFDFSKPRADKEFGPERNGRDGSASAGSSRDSAEASAPGDSGSAGKSAEKLSVLAANAQSLDAPFLYQRAVNLAKEAGSTAKAAGILAGAAKRARASIDEAGNKALIAASKGRTTDALKYARAVHGWNALLSSENRPLISNLPDFRDAVKHVLGEALESPGRQLPAPTVKFEAQAGSAGALKALVSIPDGISSQVSPVPATLAADLALPELAASAAGVPLLGGELGLEANFALSPRAGFRALYRKHRAAGRSVWEGFWLAAREYFAGAAAGVWERIRALFLAALRSLGLSAVSGGVSVDVSSADRLRALPARELPVDRGGDLAQDAFGLGYRLYPVSR